MYNNDSSYYKNDNSYKVCCLFAVWYTCIVLSVLSRWVLTHGIVLFFIRGRDCPTATNHVTPGCSGPRWWGTAPMWCLRRISRETGTELYITGNMTLTWNKCLKVVKWFTVTGARLGQAPVPKKNFTPTTHDPRDWARQIKSWSLILCQNLIVIVRTLMGLRIKADHRENIHKESK